MRLGRRQATPGRQRRASDDLKPRLNPLKYGDNNPNTGRQLERPNAAPTAWLQRFGLIILLLAVLFSAVNVLTLSNSAQVLPITDQHTTLLRESQSYQATASRILASSIWNRNKITIDTGNLRRRMLAQFPELANVTVTVPLLAHRPLVYLTPAQPALILSTSGGVYIIDSSGKAVLKVTNKTANQAALPKVSDQSGLQLQLGRQALPATQISFIQIVMGQLNAKQFAVSGLTLPPAANELDIQLAGQPYIVKFNLQSSKARQEAGTFLATIAQLQKQNTIPAKYIDVRVDGRAYYQ